mgnify:CR=1 FL=1
MNSGDEVVDLWQFALVPCRIGPQVRPSLRNPRCEGIDAMESKASREIDAMKAQATAQAELMKAQAEREFEHAKKETAENFLKFVYAEEFTRYEKRAGVYKK